MHTLKIHEHAVQDKVDLFKSCTKSKIINETLKLCLASCYRFSCYYRFSYI